MGTWKSSRRRAVEVTVSYLLRACPLCGLPSVPAHCGFHPALWSSQRLQENKQGGLAPDPTPSQRPCLANLVSCLC